MDEYTPSINVIRSDYAVGSMMHGYYEGGREEIERAKVLFDRSLAQFAFKVLLDASDSFGSNQAVTEGDVKEWLINRGAALKVQGLRHE